MAKRETLGLLAGYKLTITADAVSSGSYARLADIDGNAAETPVAVAVSTSVTIGPFTATRKYALYSDSGALTYSTALDEDLAEDEDLTGTTEIREFSGFAANFTTIPAGRTIVTPANTQAIIYGVFTIAGTFTLGGELRIGDWPF